MAPRKKPDATDTEPPEEARPDTTGTPLLVENEKVSPDVEFTPEELLKVIEYQANTKLKSTTDQGCTKQLGGLSKP